MVNSKLVLVNPDAVGPVEEANEETVETVLTKEDDEIEIDGAVI